VEAPSDADVYDTLVSVFPDSAHPVVGVASDRRSVVRDADRDFTRDMMLADQTTYLPDDILVKVDRASMAKSLEVRAPLLDHRLAEWAWTLPSRFIQRDGSSKWVLRRLLGELVPPRVTDRPKMGFAVPLGAWLRGSLRPWAEALLDDRRLRAGGYFDAALIRRMWAEHLSGVGNNHNRLWTVLMFEAWRDAWGR